MRRPRPRPAVRSAAAVVLDDVAGAAGAGEAARTAPEPDEGSRAAWEASERPGMVARGLAEVRTRAWDLGWQDGRAGRPGRRALGDVPRHLFDAWLAGWSAGWSRRVTDVGGEVPPAPKLRGPRGPLRGGADGA